MRRQCCLVLAHLDVVVHLAFHQLLPILMFITLLIVDGKWNPKMDALVLLTIGTLSLFLLKFFMKQMDGALKQDCLGVNNKHHAAETWDLEFVFQTPPKVFSNTTKKLFVKNHIICFPSLQPCWVGFKISLSLSRENAIFRDEIENYFSCSHLARRDCDYHMIILVFQDKNEITYCCSHVSRRDRDL